MSRRVGDILREIGQLSVEGVSEVTLLGQNVNSFGRDLDAGRWSPRFADLLHEVDAIDGIRRIRFTSPHPKDLRPETIDAMAECDAVCEQLHFPLQAGSDRLLARMHRGYTAERYLARLEAARAAIADLAVTTDLIVGFPGETEDDFAETLGVVEATAFDSAYTFVYSPRPGTPAAEMTAEFISPEVTRDRMERLTEAVERYALARHRARIGREEDVLVEGPSKTDAARRSGRTRQGKLVHFTADEAHAPAGAYVTVRITGAAPHWLAGDLVEVSELPRRPRTQIPVTAA